MPNIHHISTAHGAQLLNRSQQHPHSPGRSVRQTGARLNTQPQKPHERWTMRVDRKRTDGMALNFR